MGVWVCASLTSNRVAEGRGNNGARGRAASKDASLARRRTVSPSSAQPKSLALLLLSRMASTSGLSRRRAVPASSSLSTPSASAPPPHSSSSSHLSHSQGSTRPASPAAISTAGQGHKIAYDERDLGDVEEDRINPRLTLMEEVLLLGLKDKQASPRPFPSPRGGGPHLRARRAATTHRRPPRLLSPPLRPRARHASRPSNCALIPPGPPEPRTSSSKSGPTHLVRPRTRR